MKIVSRIQDISELMKGTNSNYVKIMMDDINYNFFVNSMTEKTILSNLKVGLEIEYELSNQNGFQFIKSITKILKENNHDIEFEQPKESSANASLSQNGHYPMEDYKNPFQKMQEDKSRLIALLSILKAAANNSSKNTSSRKLVDKSIEIYNLLTERK